MPLNGFMLLLVRDDCVGVRDELVESRLVRPSLNKVMGRKAGTAPCSEDEYGWAWARNRHCRPVGRGVVLPDRDPGRRAAHTAYEIDAGSGHHTVIRHVSYWTAALPLAKQPVPGAQRRARIASEFAVSADTAVGSRPGSDQTGRADPRQTACSGRAAPNAKARVGFRSTPASPSEQ
jgi:hypothetical protein